MPTRSRARTRSAVSCAATIPGLLHHVFGTFAQRFDRDAWGILVFRTVPDISGRTTGAVLPIAGLALARRRRLRYAISLAAFLLPLLAFTNLHVIHNYYA
jgi:hypothetical protein